MRKIERTIYKFEELEKDIQEKLIEEERQDQQEIYCEDCLYVDMEEKAKGLINDYFGITSDYLKVYYDLSYSQGSGAMIEFDINIADLNNRYKMFSDEEIRFINDYGIVNNIKIRHNDNFYYHEYTFGIDSYYVYSIDYDYEEIKHEYNISENDFNTIEKRLDNLLIDSNKHNTESEFIKDIISMNKELKKYGYSCLEYFWDCDVTEFLNENEYYKNGSIYFGGE